MDLEVAVGQGVGVTVQIDESAPGTATAVDTDTKQGTGGMQLVMRDIGKGSATLTRDVSISQFVIFNLFSSGGSAKFSIGSKLADGSNVDIKDEDGNVVTDFDISTNLVRIRVGIR